MSQIGRGMKSRGLFRANIFFLLLDLVDAPGIAPGSSALQADADLSQQNVRLIKFGGAERTRTVIVFIDSEVHTPFCHGPDIGWNGRT